MKRIREILSVSATPAFPTGRRVGRPVLAALALVLAGCAGFEREWRRGLAVAPPATARPTAPQTTAGPVEGAWTGTWTSTGTGHSGRLRCVIAGPVDDSGQAFFSYHATWGIFSGAFPTRQPVRRAADGSVRSVGVWTLPRWAGGRYEYDLTLQGNRLTGTWKSALDSGAMEMTRAVAAGR
jgi:hypothetical protein